MHNRLSMASPPPAAVVAITDRKLISTSLLCLMSDSMVGLVSIDFSSISQRLQYKIIVSHIHFRFLLFCLISSQSVWLCFPNLERLS